MSNKDQAADGQSTDVNDKVEPKNDSKVRDAEAVLKKNQELLSSMAKIRKENDSLLEKINNAEKEKLEADGKKDELIAKYKEEIHGLKGNLTNAVGGFVDRVVNQSFVSKAKELGVDNEYVNILYNEFNNNKEFRDGVLETVNKDTFEIKPESFDSYFNSAKEKYPKLFDKKRVNIDDLTPGGKKPHGNVKKTEKDLLDDYFKSKGWG